MVDASPAQVCAIYEKLDAGNDAGVRYVLNIGETLTEETFKLKRPSAPKLVSRWRLGAQVALLLNRAALAKVEGFVLSHTSLLAGGLGCALLAGIGAAALPLVSRLRASA